MTARNPARHPVASRRRPPNRIPYLLLRNVDGEVRIFGRIAALVAHGTETQIHLGTGSTVTVTGSPADVWAAVEEAKQDLGDGEHPEPLAPTEETEKDE